jgi:hypothetical protein
MNPAPTSTMTAATNKAKPRAKERPRGDPRRLP